VNVLFARSIAVLIAVSSVFPAPARAADSAPYGRLPAVEDMRLSPSGARYAFIGMIGDKRMMAVVQDGKALYVNAIGDVKVRSLHWADEDHMLMVITKTENLQTEFGSVLELATVMRINIKDKAIARIFEGVPSVAPRIFGVYGTSNADGKVAGYFGGITLTAATGNRAAYTMGSGKVDLYRVDLDSGQARMAAQAVADGSSDWLVSPDGKVAGTAVYDTKTGAWRLHSGNGRNKPLMQKNTPLHEIGLIGLGRTPGTLLVLDNSGERDEVLEVKVADGSTEELFKENSVTEYLSDPDTGLLIGAKLPAQPSAMFFDPVLDGRWKSMVKTFPGRRVLLQSVSRKLDRVIIKTEGGRDSGTYWMVEPATGKSMPIGSAYPAIRPPQVGETQMVQYTAEDGLKMEAVLTLPPESTGKNLPVVVMPHGGPIGVNDEIGFDWWAQAFAANGYAVLQPNYRGSSGYSTSFRDAGFGEWGKKMLSDIKDGLNAMAAKGVIDPKRACIVGASYGGYAALAGVTLQQGLYRCAVSVSGISDLRLFYQWQVDRYGRNSASIRYRRAVTGSDKAGDAIMDEISPLHFVKRTDAPVLLIHGKDDTVVPIAQSGALASALESEGKPVELLRMEGEDHWLSRESTRMTMVKASLAFVQKHNPAN
jgi:dipeptidyl aminopeptidase/acylaminoacyl peptidase